MKIILSGCGGRMGREIVRFIAAADEDDAVVCGVDPTRDDFPFPVVRQFSRTDLSDEFSLAARQADVIIDFSSRAATAEIMAYAVRREMPVVIATTGQTENDRLIIRNASRTIPIFMSANMSTGIAFLADTVRQAAVAFPEADIEIIETHHAKKEDAPSGTALMLADEISAVRESSTIKCGRCGSGARRREEIGIHSVRLGGEIGVHEVRVGSYNQTIVMRHEAHSRAMYADGAIRAAHWLVGENAGLYGMADLLGGVR